MEDRPLERGRRYGAQEVNPPLVERLEQSNRDVDRKTHVRQLGPCLLVVRLDRRIVFRESQAEAGERVEVAVSHVMDGLTHRPAARPVRRVELLVRQAAHGLAELRRRRGDGVDALCALACSVAFLGATSQSKYTRAIVAFITGVILPLSGLQMVFYVAALGAVLLLFWPRRMLRFLVWLGIGVAAGLYTLVVVLRPSSPAPAGSRSPTT